MANEQRPTPGRPIKTSIAGLGVGAVQVVRAIEQDPRFDLVAAADVRQPPLDAFKARFGGRVYNDIETLCADPEVELVWIATPNQFHCEHTLCAAANGKHIVIEKPMAVNMEEAARMVAAVEENNVKLLCGHTVSMMPAYQAMRSVIASEELGKLCAINIWSYSDWMLRPRMASELDVAQGGGVVYRQAPLQVDVARMLAGGMVRSVRAMTGQWLAQRPAPGYYAAYIEFEDGTPITTVHNGYGYFTTYEFVPWAGEASLEHGREVRRALKDPRGHQFDEVEAKEQLRFGGNMEESDIFGTIRTALTGFQGDVGIVLVSCERGDLRQSPEGLWIYDDDGKREVPLDFGAPAGGVHTARLDDLDEMFEAITQDRPVRYDGKWGMATLEVVLGIMESARERREVYMSHQIPVSW